MKGNEPKYRCKNCGHICTETDMDTDFIAPTNTERDEAWSNYICPQCKTWHLKLDEGWIKVES